MKSESFCGKQEESNVLLVDNVAGLNVSTMWIENHIFTKMKKLRKSEWKKQCKTKIGPE